jgi:transcriptional regulator with XRE-family HTH domain
MSIFSENIRLLRSQKEVSQQVVADELFISRPALSKYEEGKSEPPIQILSRLAKYYHVSIDVLVGVDLRKVDLSNLMKLSDNRILLPILVDKEFNDNIELVPIKAKAGYLMGYGDPEFIQNLEQMSLPFLKEGKFRAFPIEGDSMPPHRAGSFVVAKYLEKLSEIKSGKTYIVLSKDDGIVYKRVFRKKGNEYELHSDNPVYEPYQIHANEILEVWEHAASIATTEYEPENLDYIDIKEMLQQIRMDIREVKA